MSSYLILFCLIGWDCRMYQLNLCQRVGQVDLKVFFIFSNKHEYTVRRHQEMEQNMTKSRAGWPKATEQRSISSVTSLHDGRLTTPNISAQLNKCEKMCQNPLGVEDSLKMAYMAELLSRDQCWGSKTKSKGSSGWRCTKTGQQRNGIKSLWLMNPRSKSLGQIGRSMYAEELVKELQ